MALVGFRNLEKMRVLPHGNSSQHGALAASTPLYHSNSEIQETKPDRPIGYGAFGVVW